MPSLYLNNNSNLIYDSDLRILLYESGTTGTSYSIDLTSSNVSGK